MAGRSFSCDGHQAGYGGQKVPNSNKPPIGLSTLALPPPLIERRLTVLVEEEPKAAHLLDQVYIAAIGFGWV